jgi:hypothetical protein
MAKTNLLYFLSLLMIKNFQKHFIYVKFKFVFLAKLRQWKQGWDYSLSRPPPASEEDSENKEKKRGRLS